MRGYLITNHYLVSEKFNQLNNLLVDSAEKNDIELEVKTNAEILSLLTVGGDEKIDDVDFVLFWDKDITLCKMLEGFSYPQISQSVKWG